MKSKASRHKVKQTLRELLRYDDIEEIDEELDKSLEKIEKKDVPKRKYAKEDNYA